MRTLDSVQVSNLSHTHVVAGRNLTERVAALDTVVDVIHILRKMESLTGNDAVSSERVDRLDFPNRGPVARSDGRE